MKKLFDVTSYQKRFDANKVSILKSGKYPYIVRMSSNNGQRGFINEDKLFLNEGNTISFGQDTATMFYQEKPYFTGDKIKILKPRYQQFNKKNAQFFISAMTRTFSNFAWGNSSFSEAVIKNQKIQLPTKNNSPNFEFMETFIAELKAERIAELEAYLTATGLKEYELTQEEENAIAYLDDLQWREYNLKQLFGFSTRGKRLKSADRLIGTLPFVTAGETKEGISAHISNKVEIFSQNTTTIDMFGSAKYRNYKYGADDHVAVVHTEKLPKLASIFMTTAIHKASYTDRFSYSRNFYAKDADELNVLLPTKNNAPDYAIMELIISAVQKLIIKDVVLYANKKIEATKEVAKG